MEITVISAQGLCTSSSSSLFSHRLRPFITLTTVPPTAYEPTNGDKHGHVYQTRVDDEGGVNPTWGDKFHLPLDATFFSHRYSSIYLQLYTKRLLAGKTQLGWCQIPAADILDGFQPVGSLHHLSYRLRARDGSRGHGVVNVAVRLETQVPVCSDSGLTQSPEKGECKTVIGIPVTVSR
ncbi:hypothetical protein L1049_007107 [Liquidambar formosana]|uniref:C2 domain-containing protein n=1 Tax=Liquidambar formosana TaxID=63359 RepID=A0AAP0RFP2_LIQFO